MSPGVRCVYQILSPPIVTTRCVQKTNLGRSETGPTAPLHPQSPSGLTQPACGRAGNAGSHKGSLYLDARNQKGRKKKKAPLRTRARRVLVWLFARYLQSSPNKIKDAHAHAHKCRLPTVPALPPSPCRPKPRAPQKHFLQAPRLHSSGSVGADLLTAHAATCARGEQLFQ